MNRGYLHCLIPETLSASEKVIRDPEPRFAKEMLGAGFRTFFTKDNHRSEKFRNDSICGLLFIKLFNMSLTTSNVRFAWIWREFFVIINL